VELQLGIDLIRANFAVTTVPAVKKPAHHLDILLRHRDCPVSCLQDGCTFQAERQQVTEPPLSLTRESGGLLGAEETPGPDENQRSQAGRRAEATALFPFQSDSQIGVERPA
jgi:hypothetical protein